MADAAAAYAFAIARYPAVRIVLWGESLGSALAMALAAEKPVGKVVLEAPFTSAVDVGAQHYWFVPVRRFMKDQFRSDLRASKLTAPVLVVHGDNDAVVPIALGKRLYGLIQVVSVAGAGHNDLGARAVRRRNYLLQKIDTRWRVGRTPATVDAFSPEHSEYRAF
jgi:pimeloyl-ACP methyl ester carboxylesterase